MSSESNKIVVYAALFGNLAIALVNSSQPILPIVLRCSVKRFTRWSILNEILLLYGMKRQSSAQMPNILLAMAVNCISGPLLWP